MERDEIGAYYCRGKLSFYANGKHVGNYPKQLNTTKQYRFAGSLGCGTAMTIEKITASPPV